jgi:hypothetical protein
MPPPFVSPQSRPRPFRAASAAAYRKTSRPIRGLLARGAYNPILRNGPEQYDDLKVGPGCALWLGDDDYRMWYEGIDTSLDPGAPGGDLYNSACYATSVDGTSWTKQGRVFAPNAAGWENSELCPTSIIWDSVNSRWVMFYHGGNNTGPRAIGMAYSSDLVGGGTWTREAANPVMQRDVSLAYEANFIADAKVVVVSPYEWWCYYVARDASNKGSVVLRISRDQGLTWTRVGQVLVKGTGGQWDDDEIMAFCPWYEGGVWQGWYVGVNTGVVSQIGFASSLDGIAWTRGSANPVLGDVTDDNASDSVHVYRDANDLRLQYGLYDLVGDTLRGKGEAFVRRGARWLDGTISNRLDLAVEADFDFERTTPFTVAAWIFLIKTAGGIIIGKQLNGSGFTGWNLGLSSGGQLAMDLRSNAAGAFQRRENTSIPQGVWVHACATYDGSNTVAGIKLYRNGVASAMTDLDTNLTGSILTNVEAQIGARGGSGAPGFPFPGGGIAHVAIWNDDLTAGEVAQVAEGGVLPRLDALVAYIPLDDPNAQGDLSA